MNYVKEIVVDGAFSAEIAMVCADSRSAEMDSTRFSEAVDVASRIAVGAVSIGERSSCQTVMEGFTEDARLVNDPAMQLAWSHVSFVLETELGTAPTLNFGFGFSGPFVDDVAQKRSRGT